MAYNRESAEFANWFEKKTKAKLQLVQSQRSAKFYRYPDKKSAGKGYSNKQPADYFLLLNGWHFDLECKTSLDKTDFTRCYKTLVKDHQMTAARKTLRAGGSYLFLFCSKVNKDTFEIWDAADLINAFSIPREIPDASPIAIVNMNCSVEIFTSYIDRTK